MMPLTTISITKIFLQNKTSQNYAEKNKDNITLHNIYNMIINL